MQLEGFPVPAGIDLYQILGVRSTAPTEVIIGAWVAMCHVNQAALDDDDPAAIGRQKWLDIAHEVLTDPGLRAEYDRQWLAGWVEPSSAPMDPPTPEEPPAIERGRCSACAARQQLLEVAGLAWLGLAGASILLAGPVWVPLAAAYVAAMAPSGWRLLGRTCAAVASWRPVWGWLDDPHALIARALLVLRLALALPAGCVAGPVVIGRAAWTLYRLRDRNAGQGVKS